jgi:PAS domain S-box-containing protein
MSKLNDYVKKGSFYKAVVEDGSDIIFIIDYQGEILYVNSSVKETLGHTPQSLIGKNFFDYIYAATLPQLKTTFSKIKRKLYQESVEFLFLCKNGAYKYLEFNSINLKQKEKIEGFILDCRDITERKRDAEELKRAQKAKEQFLANISHEIRTPINGIAGMATLLSQKPSETEQATYLGAIKSAADNLKVIINDILDLASIESGKLKLEQIGFNLNDLLQSLISTFNLQALEKRVTLRSELQQEANQIFIGDPVRLNQILINLISNALKFTHKGSITIKCAVHKQEKRNYYLKFEVSDTGIGIPKDKLKTIFESFSQADASVTRKYGGTGLGLTIVKQLVELQDGSITVKSEIDAGSTFTFIIPYQKGDVKSIHQTNLQPGNGSYSNKALKHLKVLLVEDNDINRLYAGSILKTWGCEIETAENGFVAVEKIKNQTFDVVLMDIQMPVMDGFEATKAIRSFDSPKNKLPIIALTANASRRDVEKCLAEGMDDCIAKPFTPEDLFKIISRYASNGKKPRIKIKSEPIITFDLSYLKSVSNNNESFIKEMVTTFLQTMPANIEEIRTLTKQKEWEKLARATHKIKPSITLMGLHHAKEAAIEMETIAKTKKPTEGFAQLVEDFCLSLEDSLRTLKQSRF